MRATQAADSSPVDRAGDGHRASHLIGDFRDGELRGENQVTRLLQPEAQLGMDERPAAESPVGTDVVHQVLLDLRVVHGDETERAGRVVSQVQRELRWNCVYSGLPPARDG